MSFNRQRVAEELIHAGHVRDGQTLLACGDEFAPGSVLYCVENPQHFAKAVPHTCHLRICPDCERRAQAERLEKYIPAINDAVRHGDRRFRLRHVVITTNVHLTDPDVNTKWREAWKVARKALNHTLLQWFVENDDVGLDELRRGWLSWKRHGVGLLVGDEFGESGNRLHFHCLVWTPFIAGELLTDRLREYSNGEFYVNKIKLVRNEGAAVKEVLAKYATKLTGLSPDMTVRLHKVLKGHRRIRSYGIWHGLPKVDKEPCQCPECNGRIVHQKVETRAQWEVIKEHGVYVWALLYVQLPRMRELDLIRGNKSGEKRRHRKQKPPPSTLLPGFEVHEYA